MAFGLRFEVRRDPFTYQGRSPHAGAWGYSRMKVLGRVGGRLPFAGTVICVNQVETKPGRA